jgi:hypothetical protein
MTDLYDNHQWDLCNYPCPCCGYFTLRSAPPSHDICKICFWHEDGFQLRYPHETGANKVNLIEAQKNFALIGASEARIRPPVRPVNKSDRRDSTWRPIDLEKDNFERRPNFDAMSENEYKAYLANKDPINPGPFDSTRLYYWRDNYWRKQG